MVFLEIFESKQDITSKPRNHPLLQRQPLPNQPHNIRQAPLHQLHPYPHRIIHQVHIKRVHAQYMFVMYPAHKLHLVAQVLELWRYGRVDCDGFYGYVRRSGGQGERFDGANEAGCVHGATLAFCDFLEICKVFLGIDIDHEFGERRDDVYDPPW